MTTLSYALLMSLAGGFLFWLRGSAYFAHVTGRGKTTADAVWALSLSLFALAAGLTWWVFFPLAFALWLGGRLPWWRSISLGHTPTDSDISVRDQWLRHSARGICWTLPAALLFAWLDNYYGTAALVVTGALAPLFWEAGWRTYPARATEIGEFGFGALIALTLWLIL